jgi:hypothetical protein
LIVKIPALSLQKPQRLGRGTLLLFILNSIFNVPIEARSFNWQLEIDNRQFARIIPR